MFLEVDLSIVLVLRVDNHGVILLGVRATNHRDTKLIPFVGSGDGEADLVVVTQTAHQHVGIRLLGIACKRISAICLGHVLALLHLYGNILVVLLAHGINLSECQRTILVLDEFIANQVATPLWLCRRSTHSSIVLAASGRTPAPQIAVGTIAGSLAGIKTTAVEEALMSIRPSSCIVGSTSLQLVKCSSLEILHSAYGMMNLAVHQVPVVAHLEEVGTLVEAVPHHVHEHAVVCPVLQVVGNEFSQTSLSTLLGGDKHVELAVIALEDEWVAEIVLVVAEVLTFEQERTVLGPCLEVGRSSHHHSLCALVTCRQILIARIECIVKLA